MGCLWSLVRKLAIEHEKRGVSCGLPRPHSLKYLVYLVLPNMSMDNVPEYRLRDGRLYMNKPRQIHVATAAEEGHRSKEREAIS